MKFTHPALLALLSTATAIPFLQGSHPSLEEGLLRREAPHPTTPKNFPTPTMPLGTGFGGHGHHTSPTGAGKTPHHGGHGTGKPSGAVKHHSTGGHPSTDRHPRPTPSKSKSRDLPRLFPTETPPSWGSWPTGVNSGTNGGGFLGSPTGWFPKIGKHTPYTVPCPTGTGWPLPYPTGGPPFPFSAA